MEVEQEAFIGRFLVETGENDSAAREPGGDLPAESWCGANSAEERMGLKTTYFLGTTESFMPLPTRNLSVVLAGI